MEQINIKQYTIIEKIGEGGMSDVFLAFDNQLNHKVAIKKLKSEFIHNPNLKNRFIAEVKNMFRLNHPNIVKVYGLIDEADFIGAVMEYLPGLSLNDYIIANGIPDNDQIKEFVVQMIGALKYVHNEGLIHRDIKPSNFIIDNKHNLKLLDFGIAKNINSEVSDYTSTGTIQQIGTPMYMSPEQISTPTLISHSTDIYSLGLVLYFLVNGKSPFDEESLTLFELQMKIVTEDLIFKNNSPWNSIISKATQKKAENRYLDIDQFEKDVTSLNLNSDNTLIEDKTIVIDSESRLNDSILQNVVKSKKVLNKKKILKWLIPSVVLLLIFAVFLLTYETDKEKITASESVVKTFVNDLDLDVRNDKVYPKIKNINGSIYYLREFKISNSSIEEDGSILVYGTYSRWNKTCNVKFVVRKINSEYKIVNSLGASAYIDSPLMKFCIKKGYFKNEESKDSDLKIDAICEKYEVEFNAAVDFIIEEIESNVGMVKDKSNITSQYGYYATGYVTVFNATLMDLPFGSVDYNLSILNSNNVEIYTQPIRINSTLEAFQQIKADVFISDLPASNFWYKVKVKVNSREAIENVVAENPW